MKNTLFISITLLCTNISFAQTTKEVLKTTISELADDKYKGRKIGTEENEKVANYIAEQFKKDKLDYCVGDSYLIPFEYNGKKVYNVCGIKKGMNNQSIAFGAHFDHIGSDNNGEDKVYNGADDDASGVGVVLSMANHFKDKKTENSLIFITFNGEEGGLLGSKALSGNKDFQKYFPDMKMLVNLEMLGTISAFGDNKVFMTGDERSNLDEMITENAPNGFQVVADPYKAENLFFRSDNVNFYKKGVVAHSFSTVDMSTATHYHAKNDDLHVIQFDNLANITDNLAQSIENIMKKNLKPAYSVK